LVSRVRDTFQVELSLNSVFELPTIAGLAGRIEELQKVERGVKFLPMVPIGRDRELPLSYAQQRLWFLDQLQPGTAVYNIAVVLRLSGQLNVEVLELSFNELVRRHESLRTTFRTVEGKAIQEIAKKLTLELPLVDLSKLPDGEREAEGLRRASEETQRPFDLAQGPLLRAKLLKLEDQEHVLIFTIHHVISDGWSMGLLTNEMTILYASFSRNEPSPLPELSIQYADFAYWQREWLQGEVL
jgi:hypothetical protein